MTASIKTAADLFAEAQARVHAVTAQDVMDRQARGEPVMLLDVRDLHEVNLGRIPGALHISRGNLESNVEAQLPRDADVVVYCSSGTRSTYAADRLAEMGYTRVASLAGGFRGWIDAGGDVD